MRGWRHHLAERFPLIVLVMFDLRKTNDWKVSSTGDINNDSTGYGIEHWRLSEPWLAHLSAKVWVDILAFRDAYITACRRAGVTQVALDYSGKMVSVDDLADMEKFNKAVLSSPDIVENLHNVFPRQSYAR